MKQCQKGGLGIFKPLPTCGELIFFTFIRISMSYGAIIFTQKQLMAVGIFTSLVRICLILKTKHSWFLQY